MRKSGVVMGTFLISQNFLQLLMRSCSLVAHAQRRHARQMHNVWPRPLISQCTQLLKVALHERLAPRGDSITVALAHIVPQREVRTQPMQHRELRPMFYRLWLIGWPYQLARPPKQSDRILDIGMASTA